MSVTVRPVTDAVGAEIIGVGDAPITRVPAAKAAIRTDDRRFGRGLNVGIGAPGG